MEDKAMLESNLSAIWGFAGSGALWALPLFAFKTDWLGTHKTSLPW